MKKRKSLKSGLDEKLPLPKAFPEVKLFSISPKISYA